MAKKLTEEQIAEHRGQLGKGWQIVDNHHLTREFSFPDFMTGLAFVNKAAEAAEDQGHHPDLTLSWGKVSAQIFTHDVGGLTEKDFALAAELGRLYG